MSVPTEHEEQKALVKWFDLQYPKLRGRLVAVPNGGERNVVVAAKLKAEGVRKGFPDLQLLVKRGDFGGLFIEMKRTKGSTLKPEQAEWLDWLNEQGHMAVICKGAEAARQTIKGYLGAGHE